MRRCALLLNSLVCLATVVLFGCGGGGGSSEGPPPPAPNFTLSLTPVSIGIVQGSSQSMQIEVMGQNGFSGSVNVTVTGLPLGVTVLPAPLTVASGSSGSLSFAAASNAAAGKVQVILKAVSGSLEVDNTVALTVKAPPIFVKIGGALERGYYDESRQLLFASNPSLNEVDVMSGADLSLRARVPVPQPFGIDQMADGKTLVVGTFTQGIYTVDEDTLAVTQHLSPNFTDTNSTTTVLLTPVAMANGKVLVIGKDVGIYADYIYGGQHLIEWVSATDSFGEPALPGSPPLTSNEFDNLKRSSEHKWAISASGYLYLYSSDADSFTWGLEPTVIGGVRDFAANPSGTQFAVVSDSQVAFYDQRLNPVATVNATTGSFSHSGVMYSADGSRLYWELAFPVPTVDLIDTGKFTEVGNVESEYGVDLTEPSLLWVDKRQRAFLGALSGLAIRDCTNPRTSPPTGTPNSPLPYPDAIPLNTSVPIQYNNGYTPPGTTISFGGVLGTVQTGSPLKVVPPPSAVAGPVDTVFTLPDGDAYLVSQGFSYGVEVAAATATLVPQSGNATLNLFGFGMLNGSFGAPNTVTVGGQTSSNVTVNTGLPTINVLQEVSAQLPSGNPGPADITVTSNNGTGTLKNAVTYIPSATVLPAGSLLQLIYEARRNLLYTLRSTEIDVLNPSTLQWQTPLHPTSSSDLGYIAMTLTPDGSKMLVVDSKSNTLTMLSPDNPSQSTVASLPPIQPHSIVATNTGKAFIARGASASSLSIEFDLSTLTYVSLPFSFTGNLPQFAATPDGRIVVAGTNDGSGNVGLWNSANDSFSSQGFADGFWTDVAISPDGSTLAAVTGGPGLAGVAAGFFDEQLHFLNSTVYPDLAPPDAEQVLGTIFSPSGRTLVVPTGDAIEFFDVATGQLRGRLLTPEPLPVLVFPIAASGNIALDPTGQTIYAISASGLTVLKLAAPVDQLAPPAWFHSVAGRAVTGLARTAAAPRLARSSPWPPAKAGRRGLPATTPAVGHLIEYDLNVVRDAGH